MSATHRIRRAAAGLRTRGPRQQWRREVDRGVRDGDGLMARAGQSADIVGVMITITIAAVIGYIGLQVASTTENSAGFDTSKDPANRTAFENSSQNLTAGLESAFSLAEVVFIVLLLGVIIAVLVTLRR